MSDVPVPRSMARVLERAGRPIPDELLSTFHASIQDSLLGVRIHEGPDSVALNSALGSQALTFGRTIYPGDEVSRNLLTSRGVLAHEVAHALGDHKAIQMYRPKGSAHFGAYDTPANIEDDFDMTRDREKKPWIQSIWIAWYSTSASAWIGRAYVFYYAAKLPGFSFDIVGAELSNIDESQVGDFSVYRLEGEGYNSGSYSGQIDAKEREAAPNQKYSKPGIGANMSLAAFYGVESKKRRDKGEGPQNVALHLGPLDEASHGCTHVGSFEAIRTVNYHSVKNHTKVHVRKPSPGWLGLVSLAAEMTKSAP